jgi:HEAT repeat protein
MRSQQDRLAALDELGRFNRRFSVFDESVQRQVTRSIALTATDIVRNSSDPGVRLRLWEVVSGLADPYLVAPLADSLQRDSDDGVRLLAVQLLAQDFTSDPVARAALDSVSLNDSNRMIRNYARWAITDEAGRRALLTETLSDPAVPRDQRYSVLGADVGGRYGPYITRESAELLLGIAAATSQNLYWSDIISDLGNAPPLEVVPLLLERLSADPDAAVRRVAAGALLAYQEEPGVVDALRYARDNDPSPEVRLAAFTVR